MDTSIGADTVKLAGLQIDQLQKLRNNQFTLEQFEWWLKLSKDVRERYMQPDFLDVVRGVSQIVAIGHVIDCDVDPFVPDDWKVESHKKDGSFEWDLAKFKLHLSPNQKDGKCIEGNKLKEELEKELTLNANVLDYLLAHTELIPEEWKGKYIYFWGTIYRGSDGALYVRYLYWDGSRWGWRCGWLDSGFRDRGPALLRASS